MSNAGRGAISVRAGRPKLAVASLLVVVVAKVARQWRLMQSETVPTLRPFEEPLQAEDLRIAQNAPL